MSSKPFLACPAGNPDHRAKSSAPTGPCEATYRRASSASDPSGRARVAHLPSPRQELRWARPSPRRDLGRSRRLCAAWTFCAFSPTISRSSSTTSLIRLPTSRCERSLATRTWSSANLSHHPRKEYRRAARDDVAVLNVEERAEIRRLHRAEGMTIRAIAAAVSDQPSATARELRRWAMYSEALWQRRSRQSDGDSMLWTAPRQI